MPTQMEYSGQLGASNRLDLLINGLLGAPRRAPKVLKWVSDPYLVYIGQLDHFMVFGSKSTALKDFQRGKMWFK